MGYSWTCVNGSTGAYCKYANGSLAAFNSTAALLEFSASDFWSATSMVWTLKVAKGMVSDITYVTIEIVPNVTVTLGIRTAEQSLKVDRNKPIILSAVAYSNYPYNLTYAWSSSPALPSSVFATGTSAKYLKITAYALDEDARYNFTCTVRDPDGNEGKALIRVIVNRAPRFGTFAVTPTRGVSYSTQFTMKAESWYDEDTPVTYVFSYSPSLISGEFFPLSERTATSSITAALGVGKITTITAIQLRVEVFDSLNASTVVYQEIELEPPNDPRSTVSSLMEVAQSSTADEASRIRGVALVGKLLDCDRRSAQCGEALTALMSAERAGGVVSTELDESVIDALESLGVNSGESLTGVVTVLSDVAARELNNVDAVLSVADDQLESKKVEYGLSSTMAAKMLTILGNAVSGMSSTQIQQSQDTILAVADVVGRSLLKDVVPGEDPVSVEAQGVTMLAQKLFPCDSATVSQTVNTGTVRGVDFEFPICDVLPLGQTTFDEKTINKLTPYDMIIEVFDSNIMGECAPLSSRMIRVAIYNDEIKTLYTGATGLSAGVNFTFRLNSSASSFPEDDLLQVACMYYSGTKGDFTAETVGTKLTNATLQEFRCTTSHLSEFALRYVAVSRSKSFLDSEFWLLFTMFVISVIMHIWAAVYDSKHKAGPTEELQAETQMAKQERLRHIELIREKSAYCPFAGPRTGTSGTNMAWPKLFALVLLRTHSLLKIFLFPSSRISRKACTQMFWNGFFLRLFYITLYAELMKSVSVALWMLTGRRPSTGGLCFSWAISRRLPYAS